MSDDPFDDPDAREWGQGVLDDLLPSLRGSAMTVTLLSDKGKESLADVKMAVELGMTLLLDKPLVLVVTPGTQVPDHLVRCADAIIEWDPESGNEGRIHEKIAAVMKDLLGDDEDGQ